MYKTTLRLGPSRNCLLIHAIFPEEILCEDDPIGFLKKRYLIYRVDCFISLSQKDVYFLIYICGVSEKVTHCFL